MALDRLGGDYRIKTSLYAQARPDARGLLKSDLIVYGRGDPGLSPKFHGGDIFRALQPLVAALTNAGVRRISGALVGDESFFVGAPVGSGWSWDDLNYYYGAEISALSINDNTLDLVVSAGLNVGAPAVLRLTPATDLLTVSNRIRTGAANSARQLNLYRPLGGNVVYASGTIPLGQSNQTETVTISRPAELFLDLFRQALARHGVTVTGPNRVITWLDRPDAPLDTGPLVELGAIESAPLREINRWVQKPSQNLYTDLVLAHVGSLELETTRRAARPGAPADSVVGTKSSEDYGIQALETFLAKIGVSRTEFWLEEGSGLSRNNLASPAATVKLLTYMSRHPEAKSYFDALPVAGEDGTLRQRMKNSAAAGNLRAKTGTLRWANSLSGSVTTAAGEKLVFSLMLNRYAAPTAESSARAELDRIGILLASFSGRSDP
jgi:D-alanyl-D-alanine carboxypeptidase/D-alanyl-D-alanine-endopeptidase (penicillin-binding protein 4)